MQSFIKFLVLIVVFSIGIVCDMDAQVTKKSKAKPKKVESEYVPDDYVPDDAEYVPDDYTPPAKSNSASSKNTKSLPKSTASSSTAASDGPKFENKIDSVRKPDADAPLDDIIQRDLIKEKLVLAYEPLHERDIFWERRIWRVIDCREKMNLPFMYPGGEFFTILKDGIEKGEIKSYTNDFFHFKQTTEDINSQISRVDTTEVYDPTTSQYVYEVTKNDIDVQSINQYRIKEVWYFDSESSVLKVRILGIAPMIVEVDPQTGIEFPPRPLFWVYYPDCIKYLSGYKVFNENNLASPISWTDMFEMRRFSSYITKRSNVNDNRLVDYPDFRDNGVDMLLESNKIKEEIFNFEHDLWSY